MTLRQTLERIGSTPNCDVMRTSNSEALARYERSVAIAIEARGARVRRARAARFASERMDELAADPLLAPYRHMLDDLARRRPHVRSAEIEQILAQGADVARAPSDAFTALDNADLTFGRVRDETGKEIELTKARHALLLRSKDRETRRQASETFTGPIWIIATRWPPCTAPRCAATCFRPGSETIPPPGKRPVRRQRASRGLRQPHRLDSCGAPSWHATWSCAGRCWVWTAGAYDLVVPLSPEPEQRYDYREAVDLVLDGVRLLGERYVDDLGPVLRALGRRSRDEGEALRRLLLGRLWRTAGHPDELERHDERRLHPGPRGRTRHAQLLLRRQPPLP